MGINAIKCEDNAETAESSVGQGIRTESDGFENENHLKKTFTHLILHGIGEIIDPVLINTKDWFSKQNLKIGFREIEVEAAEKNIERIKYTNPKKTILQDIKNLYVKIRDAIAQLSNKLKNKLF